MNTTTEQITIELAKALASNEKFMDNLQRSEPLYEDIGRALGEVACAAVEQIQTS